MIDQFLVAKRNDNKNKTSCFEQTMNYFKPKSSDQYKKEEKQESSVASEFESDQSEYEYDSEESSYSEIQIEGGNADKNHIYKKLNDNDPS